MVTTNRHLVTHMASYARIIIRFCLFDTSLMTFTYLSDMTVRGDLVGMNVLVLL